MWMSPGGPVAPSTAASPVAGVLGPGSQVQQRGSGLTGWIWWVNLQGTTLWATSTPRAVLSLGHLCSLVPHLRAGAQERSEHVTHGAASLLKELNLFHFLNCSWEKIRSH